MGRKVTPKLSIVITCWNNYKYTASCLAHIFNSSYHDYQIIIVDNNSIDKTETLITYLVEQKEPIIYLKQKENMGFVKGNNIGWKVSQTPYCMLLNNDAFVDKKCIETMMNIIESDEKIGAVGAQEYFITGEPTKVKPYIFFKPKVLLDPELKSLEDLGYKEMPAFVDVDIIGSACSIVRKDALKGESIFDEIFHPAHFDQESAWMQIKYINGYRIVMPTFGATFKHIIAGTTASSKESLDYYMKILQINRQKFLDKWLKYWRNRK
jgi:GT2 family glycosyltransferase